MLLCQSLGAGTVIQHFGRIVGGCHILEFAGGALFSTSLALLPAVREAVLELAV